MGNKEDSNRQLDLFDTDITVDPYDTITLTSSGSDYINMTSSPASQNSVDTITLGSVGSIQLGSPTIGAISSPTYTINSNISNGWNWSNSTITGVNNPVIISADRGSGVIDLKGDNADVKVNGESLMETLHEIQDRLNILRPNKELEAEWDQLRELGEKYRQLEVELQEKSKMWKTLKSMPPPEID